MALFGGGGDDWDLSGGGGMGAVGADPGESMLPGSGTSGFSSSSSGGGGGFFNWLSSNKADIQSALKGGASLAGGTGTGTSSSSGSGVRTDVQAQGGLHQGAATTLGDLFQQLMARRAAASSGGGSRGGGLLGM